MSDYIPEVTVNGDSDLINLVNVLLAQQFILEKRVEVLEERRKKATKSGISAEELLLELKLDFQQSDPYRRNDPFNNDELVIWSSFIIQQTSRREKLVFTEFVKRKKKIKELVAFFIDRAKALGGMDDEAAEKWARIRAKDFLEYMLLGVKLKSGDYVNFWQATSAWAMNNYSDKVATWQQAKRLGDEPA
jgi:hypothetical protein